MSPPVFGGSLRLWLVLTSSCVAVLDLQWPKLYVSYYVCYFYYASCCYFHYVYNGVNALSFSFLQY